MSRNCAYSSAGASVAGSVYLMGALEKHYTVTEIAELWHFSPDTIRGRKAERLYLANL